MNQLAIEADALYQQGMALQDDGQFAAAAASFCRALEIQPHHARAYSNMGIALQSLGRLEDAVTSYRCAVQIDPNYPEAHSNLGVALHGLGRLAEAVDSYRRALELNPDSAAVHSNLAVALKHLGHAQEAAESRRRAAEISPDWAEAHSNLGLALQDIGQLEQAVESYRRALEIKAGCADVLSNLGVALTELGQTDSAVNAFERALEVEPGQAEAHHNMGAALEELGQVDHAIECYRRALVLAPRDPDTQLNLGMALLQKGDFESGWLYNRARTSPALKRRSVAEPPLPFDEWRGDSLAGKSIVVWPEQGLGDEIQFSRYAPLLKAKGARRVTVVCKPSLHELFMSLEGVDTVLPTIRAGGGIPEHDCWALAMDLPLFFRTRLDSIPATVPYLAPPPSRIERAAALVAGAAGFKVGLCWKGSIGFKGDARRSFGVEQFRPLFELAEGSGSGRESGPQREIGQHQEIGQRQEIGQHQDAGLQQEDGRHQGGGHVPVDRRPTPLFFNLVPDSRAEFLRAAGAAGFDNGQDTIARGANFAETAALLMQLDLVVTCDTAIGHLAGALGKPFWLLLPFVADWRWLERRTDSPWYPNARLFRQKQPGDWEGLMQEVRVRLEGVLAGCLPLV